MAAPPVSNRTVSSGPPPYPAQTSAVALSATLPAGTRLGRYEIIAELGTGGMATVYLGRALAVGGFQRLVAIKYLHPHLLKDDEFVQMFMDEGRLAARIHHPNVVATLDLEHTPQGIYIVSEYIEGDQLLGLYKTARAMQKRIPFPVTLRIGLDVLAGLHAAHELVDDTGVPLKIVHRDVSPQNILVGTDGIARITDFGIAKAEERISNTRDGIVKGKLSYMAPEQPNDEPVDRRADVFSAATVIWECLTGRRLFPGKTDGEVLKNLLHNPIPRLRDIDPELPEAIDNVLARALSRTVSERYATAGALADALEASALASSFAIASSRPVATYVREIAGPKIAAEHTMRRALPTRELPAYRPSSPPDDAHSPAPTPADAPAPARGNLASSVPSVHADEALSARSLAVRSAASSPVGVSSAGRPAGRPPLGIVTPPGVDTLVLDASPAPRPVSILSLSAAVLGLGLLVGSGIWVAVRPVHHRIASVPSEPAGDLVVPTVRPLIMAAAPVAMTPPPQTLVAPAVLSPPHPRVVPAPSAIAPHLDPASEAPAPVRPAAQHPDVSGNVRVPPTRSGHASRRTGAGSARHDTTPAVPSETRPMDDNADALPAGI